MDEYIAKLGIDLSDADEAVTLVGHIGAAFPKAARQAEQLENALLGIDRAAKDAGRSVASINPTSGFKNDLATIRALTPELGRAAQAENQLNRERGRRDHRAEAAAWDEEFAALSEGAAGSVPNLVRLRYALYDVGQTATVTGLALLALGVGVAAVAISFQRSFADVERTSGVTGNAVGHLRDQFDELYRTIPVGFDDLTKIGTLGGQLNINAQQLASFTEQVAKFSATSGVGVEESATAFGRLDQLLPDVQGNYEGLGDAILKVGVNSVATEAQIIAISSQLAGVANTAGLTSQEVIALSGTLASLGTAPELSRGAITRLFANIEVAISGGGEKLAAFAQVSGRTASEFARDWGNDSFAVIQDLFEGIGASGSDMGTVLRELGITASRDVPVFQKLAQNTDLLADSLSYATNAAGEVDRQYSIVSSTVAEKLNLLVNNLNSFIATVGESATGLGSLIDVLIYFLQVAQKIADNPIASSFTGFALTLGVVAGAALIVIGAMTRMAGSALALRTAMAEMNITSGASVLSFNSLTATLLGTGAAGTRAATAISLVSKALKLVSVAGIALIGMEVGGAFLNWAREATGFATTLDGVLKKIEQVNAAEIRKDFTGGGTAGQSGLAGGVGGLNAVTNLNNAVGDPLGFAQFGNTLKDYDEALAQLVSSGNAQAAADSFAIITDTLTAQGVSTAVITEAFGLYRSALEGVGSASTEAATGGQDLVTQLNETIGYFSEVVSGSLDAQNALYGLGEAIGQNGNDFSQFSVAGRENLGALMDTIQKIAAQTPGDAASTAANLQALFDQLVNGAGVSASQLLFLSQAISALRAQGGAAAASLDLGSLFQGMASGADKAAKAVGGGGGGGGGGLTKAVRTLVDYANDLRGVFSRSFDIRFGGGEGADQITSGWLKIKDAIAKTNEEIAKYQVEMQSLAADKAVREYWLSVAENYGDALRAGELRAELADIDNKLTGTAGDLAEAQAKGSKTLTGNSQAAIENRAQILGLVKNYQDYIATLAASGVPQDELLAKSAQLKAEFIQQATQLGYNSAELGIYAAAFDDVTLAISRVPRNITVTSNVNPALQALNELEAKLNKVTNGGGGYNVPVRVSGVVDKAARDALFTLWATQTQQQYGRALAQSASGWAEVRRLWDAGAYGSYQKGTSWTGSGNPWDIAGVVHNREAVLNQTGAQIIPRQMVDMANQGRNPFVGMGGSSSVKMPKEMTMRLAPDQLAALVEGRDVVVLMAGEQVATVTASVNADDSRRSGE